MVVALANKVQEQVPFQDLAAKSAIVVIDPAPRAVHEHIIAHGVLPRQRFEVRSALLHPNANRVDEVPFDRVERRVLVGSGHIRAVLPRGPDQQHCGLSNSKEVIVTNGRVANMPREEDTAPVG